ncbi:glycerophosphoryl diester phosphodiesterase membrane domain-containing protein [Latilactobacillus sakei]
MFKWLFYSGKSNEFRNRRQHHSGRLLKQSGHDLLTLKPLTMLIMIGYFLLILPFGQIIFKSVLLNKVTIPDIYHSGYVDHT